MCHIVSTKSIFELLHQFYNKLRINAFGGFDRILALRNIEKCQLENQHP